MSTIRFLKTFIAVAQYSSFAAAADRVALTNAAVGQQMRALEDEMRRPLFDRSQRQVRLNRDGLLLLPKAKKLIADYESMVAGDEVGATMEGEVAIGAITSAMGLLANCLVNLKDIYPKVSVTLMTGSSDQLTHFVLTGELDAALLVEATRQDFKGLGWTRLYEEPIVLLASSAATTDTRDALELLRTQPYIRYDSSTAVGRKVTKFFRREAIEPNEILELNSIIGITELVRQQVGVAIVPLLKNFDWQHDPLLRVLPLPGAVGQRTIGMLEQGNKSLITGEIRNLLMAAKTR